MKIILKHLAGSINGRTDSFDPADVRENIVGRDDDCAMKYDPERDDLVSRRHLKIAASSSCPSGFNIVDLQSRNGTFVNKQRIATSTCLQHMDMVQLGAGKAQPVAEAQMKAQITQLGDQLKAAQTQNKKELSQLAHSVTSQGQTPATTTPQPSPNSEMFDSSYRKPFSSLQTMIFPRQ